VAFGGRDGVATLCDRDTGKALHTLTHHGLPPLTGPGIWKLAFSADGHALATVGADKVIKLWDARTGEFVAACTGHTGLVKAVAFSPDGKTVASASVDGAIKLWDAVTGQERATLEKHRIGISSLAFSPDGRTLASGGIGWDVFLWDAAPYAAAAPTTAPAATGQAGNPHEPIQNVRGGDILNKS
jgi:WD40 repeat protein